MQRRRRRRRGRGGFREKEIILPGVGRGARQKGGETIFTEYPRQLTRTGPSCQDYSRMSRRLRGSTTILSLILLQAAGLYTPRSIAKERTVTLSQFFSTTSSFLCSHREFLYLSLSLSPSSVSSHYSHLVLLLLTARSLFLSGAAIAPGR